MAEFASKGVAGSGLGLGIAGTALGLLNNGGNGLLGGLLGIEKRNKESYHTEGDIRAYKDALKALYYLMSIEKSK